MSPSISLSSGMHGYHRPSAFEVATHWVHGLEPATPVGAPNDGALEALAGILRPRLATSPCYVAFSGGRDSSAVLAVATAVARQEGLDDPVPVTQIYPDLPETDEGEWQEAVVMHLRLREWVRMEVRDENGLLGPAVLASLTARGLLWPAALHNQVNLLGALSPGSLLTGEGGDEVFGYRRAGSWPHLRKGTSIGRRKAAHEAVRSVLPRQIRYRQGLAAYRKADLQPWLRSDVAERHLRMVSEDDAAEPFRWDRSLLWLTRRRSAAVLSHNYGLLAAEHGISLCTPLLEPRFLAAFGHLGGRFGFAGRTAATAALVGELLPPAVVQRQTKARFNRAFMGQATRDFARDWDGTGLDPDLVDAARLRQEWLAESPSALSGLLLHAAWLHAEGRDVNGATLAPTERP